MNGKALLSTSARPEQARFEFLLVLLFALIYLYLILFVPPRTPLEVSCCDDKLFLYSGTRVLRGQVIYRDFFELYFPGTDLFYALLIWVVGPRVWIPNVCLLCLGIGFLWTSIVICRRLVAGVAVFLPGLLFLGISFRNDLIASPHWYSNLLIMTATAVLAEKRSGTRLVFAGGLTGLAACFSQHHGALAGMGIAAFILWEGYGDGIGMLQVSRREFHFLVPFAAIVAACVGYFAFEAGLKNFFYSTILFPLTYWNATNDPNSWSDYAFIEISTEALRGNFHMLRPLIVTILVPGIYIVAIARYMLQPTSPPSEPWRRIILMSAVGLALFASVVNSASVLRLSTISLPAFIILVWLLDRKTWSCKAMRSLWVVAVIMILRDIRAAQGSWTAYVDMPSGRIALFTADVEPYYQYYQWLARNTRPGQYVFDADGNGLYFLFGLENPTKLWWLTRCDFTRPEQVTGVLHDLEKRQVRLILWGGEIDKRICSPTSDHIQPIRNYLHAHYRKIETFKTFQNNTVWERMMNSN